MLPALDVAIGLTFVYLLLSLICTTVNEFIAGRRRWRAKFLDRGITRLLGDDPELKRRFYLHPAIKTLAQDDRGICPSYIPADRFATALMDILSGSDKPLTDLGAIREGIKTVNPELRDQVALLLDHSAAPIAGAPDDRGQPPPAAFRAALEEWFSQTMDRVSGWYKLDAQKKALLLAACVTLVVNADTLHIVQRLWQDPSLRAAAVEGAQNRVQTTKTEDLLPVAEYTDTDDPSTSAPVRVIDTKLSEQEQALLAQLTGWDADWKRLGEMRAQGKTATWFGNLLWMHLLGWVLTAVAVSQGAPFWFDTLNKFMNVRNAGRAPAERRTKAETDGKSS